MTTATKKENQPTILVHLIWDYIHLGLIWQVLLKEQGDVTPATTVYWINMNKRYEPSPSVKKNKVQIAANNEFPFLDM